MIERVWEFLQSHGPWVVGGAVAGTLGVLAWAAHRRKSGPVIPVFPPVDASTFTKRDHVYLLMPPRIGGVPCISPFSVKLETWLRMANIPYELIETLAPSPSKQTYPYIYLNGEEMADSMFIIEKCAEVFGKKLDKHLTEMERAVFVAFSHLVEEHFVVIYVWHRYTLGADAFWKNFLPPEQLGPVGQMSVGAREILANFIKERAWQRGISRHSPEEIYRLAEDDLRAISTYLGKREFFFGREPSVIDCTLFASLVQIVCLDVDFPPKKKLLSEWNNLVDYVERMKTRFYPDWDRVCNPQIGVTN